MPSVLDTRVVKPAERLAYWHDVVCTQFVQAASSDRSGEPFNARLTSCELGRTSVGSLDAPLHHWARTARDARIDSQEAFLLSLVDQGTARLSQDDRTLNQTAGQLALYDARKPFSYELDGRTIVLKIPRDWLGVHVGISDLMCVTPLGRNTPLGALLASTLRACVHEQNSIAESPVAASHLGNSILSMLLAILDIERAVLPTSITSTQLAFLEKGKRYILANLADTQLNCEKIARHTGVSTRTLNRLFGVLGTTPMRYVWQQRLEMTRHNIEARIVTSVTEAAFCAGFVELSHFSRSFKSLYGMTPQSLIKVARQSRR